ncbi:hypothetical protein [Flavobacterium sp. Root186]|uniref:hypothetical protein n=1 Tax=Flavobacterium sp. Root186 TaxID=1736485 RepID=UPI0006F95F30|nr:hypothetical protein [Flavobacterium sp. Root186]KRB58529.1 hypothetical protein ASD98_23565 [Flavobacterium sp. Root186]
MKNIEKDLTENDSPEGSQTNIDTKKNNEDENDSFETIAPEKDNPVRKEFEIRKLGNQELKEDELTLNETGQFAPGYAKPSERKF